MQLQNQSFTSKYTSWLLKEKRRRQKLSTDLDLHQKVNTIHASLPKYIYECVSPEGPLKRRSKYAGMLAYNVFEATISVRKDELTQLRISKNDHLTG